MKFSSTCCQVSPSALLTFISPLLSASKVIVMFLVWEASPVTLLTCEPYCAFPLVVKGFTPIPTPAVGAKLNGLSDFFSSSDELSLFSPVVMVSKDFLSS